MSFNTQSLLLAFSSEVGATTTGVPRTRFFRLPWISATECAPSEDFIEVCSSLYESGIVAFRGVDKVRLDLRLDGCEIPRHRRMRNPNGITVVLLLTLAAVSSLMAEVPNQARAVIDRIIGGKGTYVTDEGVYKVVLPREAATIVLDYQTLSPNIGLNSWVAFTPAVHHEALLTGQLLLLDDEVNPVLTAALDAGLEVTGLADSSLFEGPHTKALDVTGMGTYQDLATAFRKALDEIRRRRAYASRQAARLALPDLMLESSINPGPLNAILSMRGSVSQGGYRAAIGRRALLHGEMIGREMGISSWIAFTGSDNHAVAQGEFVATSDELQNVLRALRSKDIKVTSIRNHMVGEHPQYLFVRFWEQGNALELAKAVRYVLNVQVGLLPPPSVGQKSEAEN